MTAGNTLETTVDTQAILDDVGSHWVVYASMPVIAAVLGYVTKRVAIEMMFRPLEFVGIRPFLGWQGVVPRNAERMIRISAGLLTERLITPGALVNRLDPAEVLREIEKPLLRTVDSATRAVMRQRHPQLWESLPAISQDLIVKQVQAGVPRLVHRLLAELRAHADELLDIEYIAVTTLRRDPRLTVRLIKEISRPEMRFIARCGIYSGFLLGLVQTAVWAATHEPVVLPLFGAIIGLSTDWLAIKLVFFPREPRTVLGLRIQGIFQRRRDEVARQYGDLLAGEVMTVPNVLDALLTGPGADRMAELVRGVVRQTVAEQAVLVRPLVSLTMGPTGLPDLQDAAADLAVRHLADAARQAGGYATRTMDVANTIAHKMRRLSRVEYEGLLRPAFRQDEWKLITVGAFIGLLVGELQLLLVH